MAPQTSRNLSELLDKLRRQNLCLGFAESCTGGLLSSWICQIPGVSDLYMGSVVSYSYQAKQDLLGVRADSLEKFGAVSEIVALEMLRGVAQRLKVDVAASITGIAGPTGGTADKPVGSVWFGIKGPGFERAEKKVFQGSRVEIQQQSAAYAIELLNLNFK